MTLNWKPLFNSFFSICWVMLSKPTWLLGKTAFPWFMAMVIVGCGLGGQEGLTVLFDETKDSNRTQSCDE